METEVLDISSDSDTTIIEPNNQELGNEFTKSVPEQDTDDAVDLDYLVKKYLGVNKRVKSTENPCTEIVPDNKPFETKSSDINTYKRRQDEEPYSEFRIPTFDDDLPSSSHSKKFKSTSKNSITNSEEDICGMSTEFSTKTSKEQQRLEKEMIRQEKLKTKEQKKEEENRNKAIKAALANHYKNMKPENCIKFITVQLDETLNQEDFSKHIIGELQKNAITYVFKTQPINSLITWRSHAATNILDTNGQLIDTSESAKINVVLLIMKWNDFLLHVNNETFCSYMEDVTTRTLRGKRIILAIYGLGKYYQYQKRRRDRQFKEDISNESHKNKKDERIYGNIPTVSRRTVEYVLTEVQMFYSVSHKMIDTDQELAMLVFQLTKSIAQTPYKKEKEEQVKQFRYYMPNANKNCIKMDKHGNGLSRLWKQIITTFPLASLETAEAITAIYPTPLSLFKAYESISNTEGEKLLQDLQVRRAAGPISASRRIGPELSRKIFNHFTSIDPDKLL